MYLLLLHKRGYEYGYYFKTYEHCLLKALDMILESFPAFELSFPAVSKDMEERLNIVAKNIYEPNHNLNFERLNYIGKNVCNQTFSISELQVKEDVAHFPLAETLIRKSKLESFK